MKAEKAHINLTIDEEILRWLDTLRGQTPRSTFVNQLLQKLSGKAKNIFDWDLEELLAEEDIKKGKVHSFASVKDAIKWLRK